MGLDKPIKNKDILYEAFRKCFIFRRVILSIGSILVASDYEQNPYEKAATEARECLAGAHRHVGTTVLDLDSVVPTAERVAPICVVEMNCFISAANPAGDQGSWLCKFVDGRCQKPSECVETMRHTTEFGFSESRPTGKSYTPRTVKSCREVRNKGIIYAETETDYKSVCNKSLVCKMHTGASEEHSEVMCPTQGRQNFTEGGKTIEFDLCPGPEECFDKRLKLPSDIEFIAKRAATRTKAVDQTLRRNSPASGSATRVSVGSDVHRP